LDDVEFPDELEECTGGLTFTLLTTGGMLVSIFGEVLTNGFIGKGEIIFFSGLIFVLVEIVGIFGKVEVIFGADGGVIFGAGIVLEQNGRPAASRLFKNARVAASNAPVALILLAVWNLVKAALSKGPKKVVSWPGEPAPLLAKLNLWPLR
jgi:hypothetical protein